LKNIFVGNLDFNTSEEELRQMFEAHGQVDRVSIMTDRDTGRSRGFGFVEMTNAEDGDKAIAALIAGIKDGRAGDGFVAAVEQCGAVLAEHFPPGALNRDELPNKLVEI